MRCCRKIIGIGFCVRHQSSTASKTVSQSPASAQRLNVISFRLLFNRLFAFAISRQQKGFSRASCSHAMEHETSAHGGRTKEPTKRSRKNILFCVCQGWNGCERCTQVESIVRQLSSCFFCRYHHHRPFWLPLVPIPTTIVSQLAKQTSV